MRLRTAFVLALVAAVFALPLSSVGADSPKHVQVVQTFEPARDNGTPLVQVRFSNTVVGTFAIDTGEYESVVTETFAKKIGSKNLKFDLSDDTALRNGLGTLSVQVVQAPHIKLANLTVDGQVFHVVPTNFLPLFSGRAIDGILGGDFLSRFALRIDYPAHEIGWITPGGLNAEAASEMGFTQQDLVEMGQEHVSYETLKINHYSLRADFQNGNRMASEDLWIDTGSYDTLISTSLAETLQLTPRGIEIAATLSNPYESVTRSTVAKMQIGQTALFDVSVVAPQLKNSGFPSLLGENVLSDCVVLLDFGPHRLYLKPVLPPVKADAAVPAEKKKINWDRLRNAPDLPNLEEMLQTGFAPDTADTVADQVKRLQAPLGDPARDVARLEKLGGLLQAGQDAAGAKAAFTEAVTKATAAANAHSEDDVQAEQEANALLLAGRYDEALAAAAQTTQRLPRSASAWRHLGDLLTGRAIRLLLGRQETLTETQALRLTLPQHRAPTEAEAAEIQKLLVQAHAAFDKSLALAPADSEAYHERALFHLAGLGAVNTLRQAKLKISLPAAETPAPETALALAFADLQQYASLSRDHPNRLAALVDFDRLAPKFHNRAWLTAHLTGTSAVLPAELMTADTAQAGLRALTKSADKTVAASAWTALGTVQADNDPASADAGLSWRQALALNPADCEAMTRLASHLRRTEQWVSLQELLTKQCAVQDSVPARLTLAVYLNNAGLPADAEVQVRAAKALAPDNASVNLLLADLLLARSAADPAALKEAGTCLTKAALGYGALATPRQQATLTTSQAVWLALDHDPQAAEKQLVELARKQPVCTQVREALAALIPY